MTSEGSLPSPRSFHKMVSIGKKLFVFGGCPAEGGSAGREMRDVHKHDL